MLSLLQTKVVDPELADLTRFSEDEDSYHRVCTEYRELISFVCSLVTANPSLKHELTTALECIFTHALDQVKALTCERFEKERFKQQLFSTILMEGQETSVFKQFKLEALTTVMGGKLGAMSVFRPL
tara:strand:+ start:443 stop:823 length:381 start_codon:yes stop_codon:yes gene_type:complete